MSNNKKIAENRKKFQRVETQAAKENLRNQWSCTHQAHGTDTTRIVDIGKGENSIKVLECTTCGKHISKTCPSIKDFNEAVKTIETAFDYVKIMQREQPEDEAELVADIVQTMELLNKYKKVYAQFEQIAANNAKKKKRDNNYRAGVVISNTTIN